MNDNKNLFGEAPDTNLSSEKSSLVQEVIVFDDDVNDDDNNSEPRSYSIPIHPMEQEPAPTPAPSVEPTPVEEPTDLITETISFDDLSSDPLEDQYAVAQDVIEKQESVPEAVAAVEATSEAPVDTKDAEELVEGIKEEVSKKHKAFENLTAKQKARLEYKALSRDERKKLKKRAKEVEALNKPHKGPKDVTMEGNNIIQLKDVVKYYTNGYVVSKILKGVTLNIEKGSFVIILGPSGSGKTTLMNIISGLDRASEGEVYVAGKDLITLNHKELTKFRKDNVGYVFQQYGLIPNLTVSENVEIGADLQVDKEKRLDVNELLDAVGMTEYANKFPHQLSGGQQQRVSIARAFAKNPAILFGDEPTGAIDEEMSKVVLKQFVAINKKYGTTVIMVTHNPIFQGLGDLVIKVKDGVVNQIIKNTNPKTVDELPWGME